MFIFILHFYFHTEICDPSGIYSCIWLEVGFRLWLLPGKLTWQIIHFLWPRSATFNLYHVLVFSWVPFWIPSGCFPRANVMLFWWQCILLFAEGRVSYLLNYVLALEAVEEVGVAWLSGDNLLAAWGCWCQFQHPVWGVELDLLVSMVIESDVVAGEEWEEMSSSDWPWGALSSCFLQLRKCLSNDGRVLVSVVPSEGKCPLCLNLFDDPCVPSYWAQDLVLGAP